MSSVKGRRPSSVKPTIYRIKGSKSKSKPKLVDPKTLYKKLSERHVLNKVSELLGSTKELDETEGEDTLLRHFLMRRIKKQLKSSGTEEGEALDQVAKRMAIFVEKVMYKTCERTGKQYFPSKEEFEKALTNQFKDESAGSSASGSKEVALAIYEPDLDEQLVTVEEVVDPSLIAKSSSSGNVVLLAQDDGSLIEVEEILEGDKEKALVRRKINADGSGAGGTELSTWMIEVADKTKAWANWIEETVIKTNSGMKLEKGADPRALLKISGEWKSYFDTKMKESVEWRKRSLMKEERRRESSRDRSDKSRKVITIPVLPNAPSTSDTKFKK